MYPDFIIVRRDLSSDSGYVFDLLEPHNPGFTDTLPKAKGLAKYAEEELHFGRIQLIKMDKDLPGKKTLVRLDFCKGEIREKVLRATTPEDLNNIFKSDGV